MNKKSSSGKKSKRKNSKFDQKRICTKTTLSQRMADFASSSIGSWTYILIQSIFIIIWISLNVYGVFKKWDPYPFIFLNLALSLIATYSAPIILMSQNRAAQRDRLQSQSDYLTNRKAEREIQEIQQTLARIERKLTKKTTKSK